MWGSLDGSCELIFGVEAVTYGGKMYGLPYYTDFHVWSYREDIMKEAGFEDGGRTLEDVHERALARVRADEVDDDEARVAVREERSFDVRHVAAADPALQTDIVPKTAAN